MIRFQSVKFRNFNSTGNNAVEIQLNKNNKTLFTGANGAGKSTIADAIVYALFGRPFRKCKVGELINDATNKNCEVDLVFELNSKEYRIIRGQKPKRFEIYIDGDLFEEDGDFDSKDYQKKLEAIIGVNHKTFVQVYILGNASFTAFMRLDTAERRPVVDTIFDTQILQFYSKVLLDMKKTLAKEMSDINHELDLLRQKIDLKEKEHARLTANNQGIIDEKAAEIDEISTSIERRQAKLDTITRALESIDDTPVNQLPELQKKLQKLVNFKTKINTTSDSREKIIRFLEDNDICPTCDQKIDEEFKTNKTDALMSKNDEAADAIEKLHVEMTSVSKKIDEAQAISNEMKSLSDQISRESREVMTDKSLIKRLQGEIERLSVSSGGEAESIQDEIKELRGEVKANEKMLKSKEKTATHYAAMTKMLKEDGIKSTIIKRFIPYINERANHYLASLNFHIKFHLDENFNDTIIRPNGKQVNYFSLSEGEKARVDLAVLFMWRDVIKRRSNTFCDLLILDEVFDSSIDVDGSDDLMGLLDDLSKDSKVIVISHRGDVLFDKFNSHIQFEKVNGFSKVV